MKPYEHVRKAKGYCCIMCDGPYSRWRRLANRQMKRTDRRIAKKQMDKELVDNGFCDTNGSRKAKIR